MHAKRQELGRVATPAAAAGARVDLFLILGQTIIIEHIARRRVDFHKTAAGDSLPALNRQRFASARAQRVFVRLQRTACAAQN